MKAKDTLSTKQEAFAVLVATGMSLSEAYRQAGYSASGEAVHVNASKLARQAKVETKVRDLMTKVEEARMRAMVSNMIVTAQTVTDMLTNVFVNATKDKQHGAAATAAMGLAKVHGLLVDKTEDVTRRAARSPDAPIEIDVEHWLTEQQGLPSPAGQGLSEASVPGTETVRQSADAEPLEGSDHQRFESPEPQGSEPQGSDPVSDAQPNMIEKDQRLQ